MLIEDPTDPGTFLNPDGDFIEDPTDPGTFTVLSEVLVPEHRVWVNDPADDTPDVDRRWGWVTAYDLPLTVDDGDMRVDVGLPS